MSMKKWREKKGKGWATSFGQSLGMSQNAKDMMDEGGMFLDDWNDLSDQAKKRHIENSYAEHYGDYPEILEAMPLPDLLKFMVEQPHHIEIPWWAENYESESDALKDIKDSEISNIQEMLKYPEQYVNEDEYDEWIDEQNRYIAYVQSWRELNDVSNMDGSAFYWEPYGVQGYDDTRIVWADFIIFDGQLFNDYVEDNDLQSMIKKILKKLK